MFITLTLPGYGRIVPGAGTPQNWREYDYHRAALDALHFPRLLDRWFQNLRRCAGYKVQYFGAVEGQRRLAPHFHVAIRGAVPRAVIKEVTRATYHQIWWPQMSRPVYVDELPVWDGMDYLDPTTGEPLQTWASALAELDLDEDAQPAHVIRFGRQLDVQGLLAGTPDADRSVRYLTKYLTKAVGETYADQAQDASYEAHIDRLHDEVRWLPCSPRLRQLAPLRDPAEGRGSGARTRLVPEQGTRQGAPWRRWPAGARLARVVGEDVGRPQGRSRCRGARGARGRGDRGRVGWPDGG